MRRGVALIMLILAFTTAGCRQEPAAPLEREKFVEVMVALRQAALEGPAQEDFETRKQAILEREGVSEDQLRAYARWGTRNGRALSEAYDSIAARLQRFHEPE